ncbi:hypothetical protein AB1Y20_011486 [Prymnesium parvum]|uniref:Magnesium transporter n=1 Tax=Prymnesium parvum TaxID=97485 RepID=A0AB34IJA9_PRYPA|mmetsp:Transcript_21321/g.53132  ORF Transcript_21321/g.53132 Transcript_21321/m.53132 type:complete len:398 (+) Transcript_21321:24-1217(+)
MAPTALGFPLMVAASLLTSTGLILMKQSAVVEAGLPIYRRFRWLLGFFLMAILSTLCDGTAYSLLPLAVVASFAGLNIVFTMLIASTGWICPKEPLSSAELSAAALIVIGVGTASACGPRPPEGGPASVAQVEAQFGDAGFLAFLVVALLSVLGTLLIRRLKADFFGAAPLVSTALSAYSAAACGAICALSLKCVALVLRKTFSGDTAGWGSWSTWLALVGLVFSGPVQFYMLHSALSSGRVALAVPVYQCLLILLTILAGGLFYHELHGLLPWQVVGFSVGLAACVFGLIVLTSLDATRSTPPQLSKPAQQLPAPAAELPAGAATEEVEGRLRFSAVSTSGYATAALYDIPAVSEVTGMGWLSEERWEERPRSETTPLTQGKSRLPAQRESLQTRV